MSRVIELTETENNLAEEVNKTLEELTDIRQSLKDKESILKELQSFCSHREYWHHARQCAEDDPWNECKICKAIF